MFSIKKRNGKLFKFFLGFSAVLLLVGILNIFSDQVRNSFYKLTYPVEKIFWRAGDNASVFLASISGTKELREENQLLKLENQRLLSEIYLLQCNQGATQAEIELSDISKQLGISTVLTTVIGLDASQDIVSIDKGSDSGIAEGMAVINQQGVLFGKIIKAYRDFSKVMLLSSKNSVLDVKIQQDEATGTVINGAVKGRGGLSVYLDLVPVDAQVKTGQVLITSSLEGDFPKGLLVGKVTQVYKDDQKPFLQAGVEPFFNIKNAENLFVVTNYKNVD